MKRILLSAIMCVIISFHVYGQRLPDTLWLKSEDKAAGKLLGKSKTEFRFQTSDGKLFTFSPDEVEKIIAAPKLKMRKVDPDTLNSDLLNLYTGKAVKMRNQCRALTLTGFGVMTTGFVAGLIMPKNAKPHGPPEDPHISWTGAFVVGLSCLAGITDILLGIPLWAVGGSRKKKAELTSQNLYIAPEGSMATGLLITGRF